MLLRFRLFLLTILFSSSLSAVTFTIGDAEGAPGEIRCVPIRVGNFDNVLSMQFSINYDPAALRFDGLQNLNTTLPNFSQDDWGLPFPASSLAVGSITCSWNSFVGEISLSNNDVLLELCFEVIRCGEHIVNSSGMPTPIEFFGEDENELPFTGNPGLLSAARPFNIVYSNTSGPSCSMDNGFTTVLGDNGAEPYTYLWSDGQTGSMADSLAAGLYVVTVTDALGCQEVSFPLTLAASNPLELICPDDILLTVPADSMGIFLEVAAPTAGTCPLDELRFELSGATTIGSTAGVGGVQYFNLGETLVTYWVPNADTCSWRITVAITTTNECMDFGLSPNQVISPVCAGGEDGIVNLTTLNGEPDYFYNWSNGATSEDLLDVPAGLYTITITDANDCDISASFILSEAMSPTLNCSVEALPVMANSADGIVALNLENVTDSYNVFALFEGETNLLAMGTETSLLIDGLTAGDYTFWLQSSLGCTDSCDLVLEAQSSITCNRSSDSLVLVDFYESTDGTSWDVVWNLSEPLDTWYGVLLSPEGCVRCLDLDGVVNCGESLSANGNNLVGNLPTNLGQLRALEGLYLTDNFITGGLPASMVNLTEIEDILLDNNQLTGPLDIDFSNLTQLNLLLVDFNRLTFEDVLPVVSFLETISSDYAPQAVIFPDSIINAAVGEDVLIDLGIDLDVTDNLYRWEKDGLLLTEINGISQLSILNVSTVEAGLYTVSVTNSSAPDLVLESGEIQLNVLTTPLDTVLLDLPNITTNIGEQVCVPISTEGFNEISGFQFLVNFDSIGLRYDGITNVHPNFPDPVAVTVNEQSAEDLFLSWVLLSGGSVSIPEGEVLVELCFTSLACGNFTLEVPLALSGEEPVFGNEDFIFLPVETNPGSIQVNSALTLDLAVVNPSCGQANGSIAATIGNGSGNYTYLWNNTMTAFALNDLAAGESYSLTVTDEETGCVAMISSATLTNEGNSSTEDISRMICAGESFLFDGTALTVAGNYSAIFQTTPTGCDSTVNLTLTVAALPLAQITGDTTFCVGDGPQLLSSPTGDAYNWEWSTGESTASIQIDGSLPQIGLTVTNAAGCSSTDVVQILTGEAPEIMVTGDTISCGTAGSLITASGGTIYNWSTGGTSPTEVLTPGVHAVVVSNAAGCSSTELVTVTQREPPVLPVYESGQISCLGDVVVLELLVAPPLTVDWYDAQDVLLASGQTTYSPSQSGEYSAIVRDTESGCQSEEVAIFNYSATDILAPIFVSCPADQVLSLNTAMMSSVTADWELPMAMDNCELASLTSNLEPGTNISESTQVIYTATDLVGNSTNCVFNINVQPTDELLIYVDSAQIVVIDSMARVPICVTNFTEVQGLSFSLRLLLDTIGGEIMSAEGINPLLGDDNATVVINPATGEELRFLWSDPSGNPTNLTLPDSSELFYVMIKLTGEPGACSMLTFADDPLDRVVSRVGVLEATPSTLDGPVCLRALAQVAGRIFEEDGSPVGGVQISCASTDETRITLTDEAGYYEFRDLPLDQDYELIPLLDTLHRNGINIIDRTILSRHILQIQLLTNPYLLIAADVTGDGSVNIIDFVQVGYMTLQLFDDFPTNMSWRFIDADYEFPNPANPWQEVFPETRRIIPLRSDSLENNFIGVKIGDLNGSADNLNDMDGDN